MKYVVVYPVSEEKLFKKGALPKGNHLANRLPFDIKIFFNLLPENKRLINERKTSYNINRANFYFIYVDFHNVKRAIELISMIGSDRVLMFGPGFTYYIDLLKKFASGIKGYAPSIIKKILSDIETNQVKKIYIARSKAIVYNTNLISEEVSFISTCTCSNEYKKTCSFHLFNSEKFFKRNVEEVIGEVLHKHSKRLYLIDDDVSAYPEEYKKLFYRLWPLNKEWVVNAGSKLFETNLIPLLSKAGVKLIVLNNSWMDKEIFSTGKKEQEHYIKYKKRDVKLLHKHKIISSLHLKFFNNHIPIKEKALYNFLIKTGIDLVLVEYIIKNTDIETYIFNNKTKTEKSTNLPDIVRNHIFPKEYVYTKTRFYSLKNIFRRMLASSGNIGFYNTLLYFLRYNLSYRLNLLEGFSFPP